MFQWLGKLLGLGKAPPARAETTGRRHVRAAYDASQSTDENTRHWQWADALSARTANSPGVRKTLRDRARYERDNNSYLDGTVQTLSSDLVGTGPQLQIQGPDQDSNRLVQTLYEEWSEASGYVEKLRSLKEAKCVNGESFGLLVTNQGLPCPVKLDVRELEADQCTTPDLWGWDEFKVDGIAFDADQNPKSYDFLKFHPGDLTWRPILDYDTVPAASVVHWFRRRRAGQVRGIPDVTAALPLFAQMRRYTLAVLGAAETAANIAAVVKSNGPPNENDVVTPFETMDIERNMLMNLPQGWDINQLRAEQPTSTFDGFQRCLAREIGRCINVPLNIVLGDSSGFNYSSARLDALTYRGSVKVERRHCETVVLDHVFRAWLAEARLIPGYLPASVNVAALRWTWHWPGFPAIDPVKDATADDIQMGNGTKTLMEVRAEGDGALDWEQSLEQQAKEFQKRKALGLPQPGPKNQAAPDPADQPDDTQPAPAKEAAAKALPFDWRRATPTSRATPTVSSRRAAMTKARTR